MPVPPAFADMEPRLKRIAGLIGVPSKPKPSKGDLAFLHLVATRAPSKVYHDLSNLFANGYGPRDCKQNYEDIREHWLLVLSTHGYSIDAALSAAAQEDADRERMRRERETESRQRSQRAFALQAKQLGVVIANGPSAGREPPKELFPGLPWSKKNGPSKIAGALGIGLKALKRQIEKGAIECDAITTRTWRIRKPNLPASLIEQAEPTH